MTVTTPRLLVVSESRITRRVIEMTFADQSVDLVSATTGPDGLAEWERQPATIVIADLVMDGLDGLGLARQLADRGGDASPAVLLLASQTDMVDEAAIAAAGVRAVLRKPLDSLELVEAVRAARCSPRPTRDGVSPAASSSVAALPPAVEPAAHPVPDAAPVATPAMVAPADEPSTAGRPAAADAGPADAAAAAWPDLRDADLERVAERVAAIWSGDVRREERVTALVAERAGQLAATSAAAAVERVAPVAASEAAERLVRELAPRLVAEVARLVVADVSERLVREEIARLRAAHAAR
jgi:CheY-like chemotaxis protein